MKFFRKYFFLYTVFCVFDIIFCFSQDRERIDSLENALRSAKEDTVKVMMLKDLSFELRFVNTKESITRALEAAELSKKIKFIKGEANSLNVLGLAYNASGEYQKAIEFHNKAMDAFSRINDSIGLSKANHNIGYAYSIIGQNDSTVKYYLISLEIARRINHYQMINTNYSKIGQVFLNQGNYVEALEYSQKALKSSEEMEDMKGQAVGLNNIGTILKSQNKYNEALEYYNRSLAIAEKITDKSHSATALNNIGTIYDKKNMPDDALKYYFRSLKIKEDIGNLSSAVSTFSNIAILYKEKGNYDKATEYNNKALDIDKKEENMLGISTGYLNLAEIELLRSNFSEARAYLDKSLDIAQKSGYRELLVNIYSGYTSLFEQQEKYREAYEYHVLYSLMKDSLLNEEGSKQITEMQTKYESEKKQKEIELLNKEKELQNVEIEKKEAEVKKQNTQKIAFGAGFVLVLLLALVIFRGYKQKEKTNLLLARQKQQIEIKNTHLENANEEISKQKNEIEEKNHEILASIRYAQRIQQAILPPSKLVKQHLEQSFILYKPKDIVAGDFYWMHPVGERGAVLFAACDCTGHGVPGAFVSIVGNNALNRAVKEFSLSQPSSILDKVNDLVQETFSKSENEMKDGMDIALCSLETATGKFQYSGANNSMYYIRNRELKEIKADKQPIGNYIEKKPFTNHEISLQKGDAVYIFSDGYADQFGGAKGKKFKYSQFEKLLVSIQDKSMEDQKEILDSAIEKWRGSLEQVDDICVIGVQV